MQFRPFQSYLRVAGDSDKSDDVDALPGTRVEAEERSKIWPLPFVIRLNRVSRFNRRFPTPDATTTMTMLDRFSLGLRLLRTCHHISSSYYTRYTLFAKCSKEIYEFIQLRSEKD